MSLTATSQGDRYHVQGVQRAFKLLRILAASRRPMSLAEIARESGSQERMPPAAGDDGGRGRD